MSRSCSKHGRVIALLATMLMPPLAAGCSSDQSTPTEQPPPPPPPPPPATAQREWTVMVFMAADNDLTVAGVQDIDEMEAAGVDPKVQVVVQAEFNPDVLAQYDCTASCINRPNFNTFRYALTGRGQSVDGPNGSATDIGDRNMTDPAQLREFIQWAKQTYPANRYALILWNHGGGYTGLLQDVTTAGSDQLSLAELRGALQGVGKIDVLAFDMCLMAGYETLSAIKGLADFAVFSEEVLPGAGFPYTSVVDAIQASGSSGGKVVAELMADKVHESYADDRASTTISSYDLAQFALFEQAVDALADVLIANLATARATIVEAAAASQKYTIPELTDIGSFLDELSTRTTDATLRGRIDALRTRATGGFRLRTHARNGSDRNERDVGRSTGLHIVLPTGQADDQFAASGPRSFAAYRALHDGKPWTSFLAALLGGQPTLAVTDQGDRRFQGYLLWDPVSIDKGVDIDLWVIEPDGRISSPFLGSASPNGTLTNDSREDGTYFEGYTTNRHIQNGQYIFLGNLFADPQDFRPRYDFVYRRGSDDFTSLYEPNYPRLSKERSWMNDDTPTVDEIVNNAYTDLRIVAVLTVGEAPAEPLASSGRDLQFAATGRATWALTTAQARTLRAIVKDGLPAPRAAHRRLPGYAGLASRGTSR